MVDFRRNAERYYRHVESLELGMLGIGDRKRRRLARTMAWDSEDLDKILNEQWTIGKGGSRGSGKLLSRPCA